MAKDVCLDKQKKPLLQSKFDYLSHCIYCGEKIDVEEVKRRPTKNTVICRFKTTETIQNILTICDERNDEWGEIVRSRIDSNIDFASKGQYHKICNGLFRLNRASPPGKQTNKSGRPIGSINQSKFQPEASEILRNECNRNNNIEEEKRRILDEAIIIIQEEIRSSDYDCSVYPSVDEIAKGGADQVGGWLKYLLRGIMKPNRGKVNDKKMLSVAHSVIASNRPRSFVSALHVGVGVFLHRRFRSKNLINLAHNLGFSTSYAEIQKYENSVTVSTSTHTEPEAFVQYVFDNADHNAATVDGHGTVHIMGGIKCVTPASSFKVDSCVPRLQNFDASIVGKFGYLPIHTFNKPRNAGLKHATMKDVESLQLRPTNAILATIFDWIWMAGDKALKVPHTAWSGYMEVAAGKRSYEQSAVIPVPFVNLDPNNMTTIYSCLRYAAEECKKHNQICLVTLDQPLYIKAMDIILQADSSDIVSSIVALLALFHVGKNFIAAIGKIMAGSGIEALWEQVFAKKSVVNMLNGNAYARALRAHSLTRAAIGHIVLEWCVEQGHLSNEDIQSLRQFYKEIFDGTFDVSSLPGIENTLSVIECAMKELEQESRTARLWFQYFRQTSILHDLIRAERSGDWGLHMYAVQRMLPHLHAAGHVHYAKAAHLYLQNVMELENRMTETEFKRFTEEGFFTIRRSDKFWCGLPTDLVIEQVLMRSMKVTGGLTQGRGITDSIIARWVATTPGSLQLIEAVETFAEIRCETCDQHFSLSQSWQARDTSNIKLFVESLRQHRLLQHEDLVALFTGNIADESVNCDQAEEIGAALIRTVTGKSFNAVTLRRKDQVVTFDTMQKTMMIDKEQVIVNPDLLLHRIACVVRSEQELEDCLRYELAPYPQSLFDSVGMRSGAKSKIVQVIDQTCKRSNQFPENPLFVVDGGDLLHRVHWPCPANFRDVCDSYKSYISKHFGENVIIVFDGYEPSTKDAAHYRRTMGKKFARIEVAVHNHVTAPKDQFLANMSNKINFIKLLGAALEEANVRVCYASGDADVLIVETAKTESMHGDRPVVVVGADSDLLVLISASCRNDCPPVYLQVPDPSVEKIYCSIELQDGLQEMACHILFLHAMMGCDTTSALYYKSHKVGYNLLKGDGKLQRIVAVFQEPYAKPEDIITAGESFLVKLYGGKNNETLNRVRFKKYVQTVAKKSANFVINLATLPPTSAAAGQHSLRVYHQVQSWKGRALPPQEWGWKYEKDVHVPIRCTLPPAPGNLLHLVRCGCKLDCSKNCECKRAGLYCTTMCSVCAGEACLNKTPAEEEEDEEEDEDETFTDRELLVCTQAKKMRMN